MKNFMPYIEKMPMKRREPFHVWATEILLWLIIFFSMLYFAPVVWRIFTR